VELSIAQKLARHSTPVLTANVYTKLRLHDLGAAVNKLPSPTKVAEISALYPSCHAVGDREIPDDPAKSRKEDAANPVADAI
jgi:hypothetical protein